MGNLLYYISIVKLLQSYVYWQNHWQNYSKSYFIIIFFLLLLMKSTFHFWNCRRNLTALRVRYRKARSLCTRERSRGCRGSRRIDFTAVLTPEDRWLRGSRAKFFMSDFLCDRASCFRLRSGEQGILQGTLNENRQAEHQQHRRLAAPQQACAALEPAAELHPEWWNSTSALLGEVRQRTATVRRISKWRMFAGRKSNRQLAPRNLMTARRWDPDRPTDRPDPTRLQRTIGKSQTGDIRISYFNETGKRKSYLSRARRNFGVPYNEWSKIGSDERSTKRYQLEPTEYEIRWKANRQTFRSAELLNNRIRSICFAKRPGRTRIKFWIGRCIGPRRAEESRDSLFKYERDKFSF